MTPASVTVLLTRWREGDRAALEELTPLIYAELRRLARSQMRRERAEHTFEPTALVHEAYLKLAGQQMPAWESRAHFLAIASQLMRQVLVDYSRRYRAARRGGGGGHEALDENLAPPRRARDVMALDDAVAALGALDPKKSRMVELRYFGGLTAREIALVMGISTATVTREMRMAEAWLAREVGASRDA